MKLRFRIVMPSELSAGLRGFTDEVTVEVVSGDPGGDEGEFGEHIRESLREWYDGASVERAKEGTANFKKGMRVRYFPSHVSRKNPKHSDVRYGCVSSTNDRWVFVKYDNNVCEMTTGDEPFKALATSPDYLEIL